VELLTEQEVSKSWRQLFNGAPLDAKTISQAEALIDELRPESPLRHRLSTELEELRQLQLKKEKGTKKGKSVAQTA
jgi:hypothetical protein